MALKSVDFFFLTLGSVVGILAILTSAYPAVIAGYLVLVLAFAMAFVVALHEGKPYYMVREGTKVFLAVALVVWALAVVASATLAVFA
ncbi:hypothetical protein CN233_04520 [Sinorhizobium meliloti]|uniref:hypothetical protein n=1 Tax=Rhizobium meliloti TaxID=382 RepID=UPI000FD75104|nr:hypothetical protein [Sinorhizobium meliloti]MDX0801759.1 hypothetical protein [Sinorhizobium medicae]RVG38001.1 hypothetical protein CN233_04520 [Sinorhizobium meliloti]RVL01916.1 hypothetical protein CN152_10815 [Sinorhizobium meliloti]RVM26760.1 hypothetical protein CN129_28770 [Sinorhizobium meliloti]RVN42843.1 hypothetical protein CN113_22970 [Sinorhizobium meliloti]